MSTQATNDDIPAAVSMTDALKEFDTPTPPEDLAPSPMDDFLANFDPPKPDDTAPGDEPKPDDAPPGDEPKPEDADLDDFPDDPPGKGSEPAKKGWREVKSELKKTRAELRDERNKAQAEIAARDAELAELRKQAAAVPELSEKVKFIEEAEKELAISRVEGTREYKETVLAPLKAIEDAAKVIAEANSVDTDKLLDAIAERDPAKRLDMLEEVVSGLRETHRYKVMQMAEDAQAVLTKRDAIRERAAEARKELDEITEKNTAAAREKARRDFTDAAGNAVKELRKRVPFSKLADGETEDGVFDGILKKAGESDFDAAPASTKAFAAVATVMLPRVTRQLVAAQAEIKKLEARIAEGARTAATIGGSPSSKPAKGGDDDDFLAVTAKHLGLAVSHPQLE